MNLNLKPNSEFLLQLFSVYLVFDVIGVTITIMLLPTLPLSGLWQDEIKSYLFTLVKSENKTKRCTPTATGIGRNSNNLALDSDETIRMQAWPP
jgi:hypothetical protein